MYSKVWGFKSSMEIKFFNIYSMMGLTLQISELQQLFDYIFAIKLITGFSACFGVTVH